MHPRLPLVRLLPTLALALALSGCATTNPYVSFADAGSAYAARIDEVLVAAEATGVEATSWRLLDNDALSNTTLDSYVDLAGFDRGRAVVLRRLREHATVLSRYFGALSQLSTSEAPTNIADQAGRAHGALETAWETTRVLGKLLRGNLEFPPEQATTETAKIMVSQVVSGVLRKELQLRGDLIAREIATQEALLDAIDDVIGHDIIIGSAVAERLLVIDPLMAEAPVRNPEAWVATRQRILLAERSMEEVRAARAAAKALRETFEAITRGGAKAGKAGKAAKKAKAPKPGEPAEKTKANGAPQ